MYYNVVEAKYIGEYKLELIFEDGKRKHKPFRILLKEVGYFHIFLISNISKNSI